MISVCHIEDKEYFLTHMLRKSKVEDAIPVLSDLTQTVIEMNYICVKRDCSLNL